MVRIDQNHYKDSNFFRLVFSMSKNFCYLCFAVVYSFFSTSAGLVRIILKA